jgi:hypothetical protein
MRLVGVTGAIIPIGLFAGIEIFLVYATRQPAKSGANARAIEP